MMILLTRWGLEGKHVAIRADAVLVVFDRPDGEGSEVSYFDTKGNMYTARVTALAKQVADLLNDYAENGKFS